MGDDDVDAEYWFRTSDEAGDAEGRRTRGRYALGGSGGPGDLDEFRRGRIRAAAQDPTAAAAAATAAAAPALTEARHPSEFRRGLVQNGAARVE